MNTLKIEGTYPIEKTTAVDQLILAPGTVLTAPEGKNLTLTVDGNDTPLLPGSYTGQITISLD